MPIDENDQHLHEPQQRVQRCCVCPQAQQNELCGTHEANPHNKTAIGESDRSRFAVEHPLQLVTRCCDDNAAPM